MLVKKKTSNSFLLVAIASSLLLLILLSLKGGKDKTPKIIPEISQKTSYNSLEVILNEKHFKAVKKKRNKALRIGVLQTSDDDYVPATIRYNAEDYKADLRLKGDWTDHLKGDKWSFRIKLKNDRTIKGMRKFSVHHPGSRGYLNEWLFHKVVKEEGMIGLRYDFLEGFLHINLKQQDTALTKAVGVYAIEETFDNRLIENNGRKVGVILKYTEDNIWRETAKVYELARTTGTSLEGKMNPRYSSESNMTITAFSLEKILADETLKKQFTLAKNLLNGYKKGQLKITEIFDVEMTARFTAIANLFGGIHGLTTHNLRFFYNPITSRMEPIAFDNNSGTLLKEFKYYWNSTKDPVFMQAQIKALEEISAPEYLDSLIVRHQTELNVLSTSLEREFPEVEVLSIEVLKKNQEMMRNTLEYLHNTIERTGKNSPFQNQFQMMKKHRFCFLLFAMLFACNSKEDYYKTPSFSEKGAVNAVVEIPAGTNTKYEYDPVSKEFVIDQENGIDRIIDFIPYPANYGFVPSTLSDASKGGDGDALDILVLSESLERGTIVEVLPIGLLKLIDNGEQDYKIIAVPSNPKKRIVNAKSYKELQKNYPAIIEIIELWFLNYNKKDAAMVEGWGNEKEALKEIKQAVKK